MHDRKQDWKTFTKLKEVALERFFEQAMKKFASITQDSSGSAKERYHKLFKAVQEEDQEIINIFDQLGHSRTNADIQLMLLVNAGLLTKEELAEFSEETLEKLRLISEI